MIRIVDKKNCFYMCTYTSNIFFVVIIVRYLIDIIF